MLLVCCFICKNKSQTKPSKKNEVDEDELMYLKARSRARVKLMDDDYYSYLCLGRGRSFSMEDHWSRLDDETDIELLKMYRDKYR